MEFAEEIEESAMKRKMGGFLRPRPAPTRGGAEKPAESSRFPLGTTFCLIGAKTRHEVPVPGTSVLVRYLARLFRTPCGGVLFPLGHAPYFAHRTPLLF